MTVDFIEKVIEKYSRMENELVKFCDALQGEKSAYLSREYKNPQKRNEALDSTTLDIELCRLNKAIYVKLLDYLKNKNNLLLSEVVAQLEEQIK